MSERTDHLPDGTPYTVTEPPWPLNPIPAQLPVRGLTRMADRAHDEYAALTDVAEASQEYVEQQELRREIGRQGRADLGDTMERPVPPDYERLREALQRLHESREETR